jgi:hypothetical protein
MSNYIYIQPHTTYSYQILAPTEMYNEKDQKKSAQMCFDKIGLDPELYRIGHTKASKRTLPEIFLVKLVLPPPSLS